MTSRHRGICDSGSLILLVAMVLTGCTTEASSPDSGDGDSAAVIENDPSTRIGSAAVYERIETSTDCVALQREFDIAMENVERREVGDPLRDVSFSYAKAADNRMDEIGCYG